jgi:CHAT domain
MARSTDWQFMMRRGVPGAPTVSSLRTNLEEGDRDWALAASRLERMRPYVFEVHADASSGTITLSGSVVSEEIKEVVEELFRDYDPNARLTNAIEVTAPFRSAEQDDDGFESKAPASKHRVVVERYPRFGSEQPPSTGERFRFEVDLTPVVDDGSPIRMELPHDWTVMDIDVQIVSAQLGFADGADRRKIVIERDGKSMAARFEAEVLGVTDEGFVDVQAVFNCRGRFSGMGRHLYKAIERTAGVLNASSSGAAPGAISIHPTATPPVLTIQILDIGDARWMWVFEAPRTVRKLGKPERNGIVVLGDTQAFATGLLSECPDLVQGRHGNKLRGIGEQIWAAAPETFRVLYKDMRQAFGAAFTIQIVTDEPHVPWEMMFPDAQSGISDPDHLFMTHPMGRWYASRGGWMPSAFERGSIASFVPVYPAKSRQALPAAIEEGAWLVENLGAKAMNATWEGFTSFWSTALPAERVAVLHFAGHGENMPTPRIKLADGTVSCDEVNGSVRLGVRDHPFVVLNACETGGGEFRLGMVSGWAASLTTNEFGGVLAPLWKVEDDCASQVVRSYIGSFCKGVPIGLAMQRARAAHYLASPTAYAYVCHGDVNARMV